MYVVDIALRALTVGARALFTFYLVKILSLDDFGVYTYLLATVGFFMYVAGADFYAYAHRELLTGQCDLAQTVKGQSVFLLFSVLVAAGLSVGVAWGSLSRSTLLVLPLLLAGEALSAECVRLLIVCNKPSAANTVLFLKSAAWMLPLWAWAQWRGGVTLEALLLVWSLGLFIAVVAGVGWTPVSLRQVAAARIPAHYFRQAGRMLPKILLGTIALRALFSLDRLAVGYGFDAATLGTYGFFVAVASAYLAILDIGVLARLFPPLVAAVESNPKLAHQHRRTMELAALGAGSMAWLVYLLLIDSVIGYIDKPFFLAYKNLGSIILLAYVVYAASMGAHYFLYGLKKDVQVMAVHVVSFLPFSMLAGLALYGSQPELVAWGVVAAMGLQWGLKTYLVRGHG